MLLSMSEDTTLPAGMSSCTYWQALFGRIRHEFMYCGSWPLNSLGLCYIIFTPDLTTTAEAQGPLGIASHIAVHLGLSV
jgi:hypothetical protein